MNRLSNSSMNVFRILALVERCGSLIRIPRRRGKATFIALCIYVWVFVLEIVAGDPIRRARTLDSETNVVIVGGRTGM